MGENVTQQLKWICENLAAIVENQTLIYAELRQIELQLAKSDKPTE
jgi:P pilus assembly chaperone PapD